MSTKNAQIHIDLQFALSETDNTLGYTPQVNELELWLQKVNEQHIINDQQKPIELTVRIVEPTESQALNAQYRGKQSATNILSFPSDIPDFVKQQQESDYLGDLIVCAEVLRQEAKAQNKEITHHWAHIFVHGVLHLMGYDHIDEAEAQEMENLERQILQKLAIDDPYLDNTH